jgi:two-component system cell cycle response regulator DivK
LPFSSRKITGSALVFRKTVGSKSSYTTCRAERSQGVEQPNTLGEPEFEMSEQRILIVDDNPVNLKLIRILLTGEGYDVHTASDAEGAIRVLRELRPRMILMDIQLPGIDGLELTRRLKADPTTRDITILGLTAYAMKGDEEKILAAGCDGYIAKPIDTRTLPGIIQRYLEL